MTLEQLSTSPGRALGWFSVFYVLFSLPVSALYKNQAGEDEAGGAGGAGQLTSPTGYNIKRSWRVGQTQEGEKRKRTEERGREEFSQPSKCMFVRPTEA
jgi:hypothetical protein